MQGLQREVDAQVHISELGCLILKLLVPDKNGNRSDIVLGYDSLQEYLVRPLRLFPIVRIAVPACLPAHEAVGTDLVTRKSRDTNSY